MSGAPPRTARALRLMLALAARAWINRIGAGLAARRSATKDGAPPARRKPTGRVRRAGIGALIVLLTPFMLFQGVEVSSLLLYRLGLAVDPAPHVMPSTMATLRAIEQLPPERRGEQTLTTLRADPLLRELSDAEREARARELLATFAQGGRGALREAARFETLPDPSFWPPGGETAMRRVLGLIFCAIALLLLLLTLGLANQDLGRVEWRLHWLATLPVPTRTLFLARALEYGLVDPLLWGLLMPMVLVALVTCGHGWWSLLWAVPVTALFGLCVGAGRAAAETFLRLRWPLARLKNVQAVCTVMGMLLMAALYGSALRPELLGSLIAVSRVAPWEWLPWGWPALIGHGLPMAAALGFGAVVGVAAVSASVAWCSRLSAGGMVLEDSPVQGKRGGAAVGKADAAWKALGPLARDLLLLRRDRNLLVQAMVVPPALLGMQLLVNRGLLTSMAADFRHVATFAYALGAYTLMITAGGVLAMEGASVWLLCALPERLERVLVRKTLLWVVVALAYAWATMIVAAVWSRAWTALALADAVMVSAGLVVMAFVAAGIGSLSTDPLERELKRRMSPSATLLTMILSSMFGFAVFSDSLHLKLAYLALSGLLAYALWQKLRDRLPYLLDPTAAPPPTIDLGDGLIAALSFLVLQGLIALTVRELDLDPGALATIAFAVSGAVTAGACLIAFWRLGVPDLLRAVGLRAPRGARWAYPRAVAWGAVGAVVAAAGAWAWLRLLEHAPSLRGEPQVAIELGPHTLAWVIVLTVVAAPLCEEFIFRGLVFGGIARSLPWGWAALASAAIFALVHPTLSVVPVLGLGLAAAVAYRMSGLLLGGIIVHAGYNALVLLMQPR